MADKSKIRCGRDCVATYQLGSTVELRAGAKAGYKFKKWTGACTGTTKTCVVSLDAAKTVGAKFVAR